MSYYHLHSSTDGIGMKGFYHWYQGTFRNAALDFLAMNFNDMPPLRAKPKEMYNHITLPKENYEAIYEIIGTMVEECNKRNITIDSGETSIHEGTDSMEISGTIVGKIERYKSNEFHVGDSLIGIKSSGLMANGFTKIRELFREEKDKFRKEFTVPTTIYSDAVFDLMEKFDIHGMVQVTGGAYTKLKEFLKDSDVYIFRHNLKPQDIFYEIQDKNIQDEQMYITFNCGVGFVLSVNGEFNDRIISELTKRNLEACVIGKVKKGEGKIRIDSYFNSRQIIL